MASREAEARRAADFRFFSCQVSPLERSSLSVSTKEATRFLQGHVRIFHGVVQGGGRQDLLVVGHARRDRHRFEGMDDIRQPFSAPGRTAVGFHGKENRPVEQGGVQGFISHIALSLFCVHEGKVLRLGGIQFAESLVAFGLAVKQIEEEPDADRSVAFL